MVSNFVETTDWVKIAHKLRQHNRDLVKTVVHLEQALAESQERLQRQIRQLFSPRSGDHCANATAELELHTGHPLASPLSAQGVSQEQVACLLKEIEASYQAIQRQQIVIETLSKQLEASQERVAQLERECALFTEQHSEQTHQLVTTQAQVQALQEQLTRQQQINQRVSDRPSSSFSSKAQSIQPWSAPAPPPSHDWSHAVHHHKTTVPARGLHAADQKLHQQRGIAPTPSGAIMRDKLISARLSAQAKTSPSYLLSPHKKGQARAVELPSFLHC